MVGTQHSVSLLPSQSLQQQGEEEESVGRGGRPAVRELGARPGEEQLLLHPEPGRRGLVRRARPREGAGQGERQGEGEGEGARKGEGERERSGAREGERGQEGLGHLQRDLHPHIRQVTRYDVMTFMK